MLAHHQLPAYDQTLWQIFLNSSPFKSQFFSILSDLKCYWSAFSSLPIIFQMQSQRTNQKEQ